MGDVLALRRTLGLDIDVLQGFAFSSSGFSEEKGLPLVRIRDLTTGTTETRYSGPYSDEYVVDHGDVLIGMDGEFRVVRWSGGRALLNQRVCRVCPSRSSLDDGFLFYAIQPEIDRVHRLTPQTTVRHLNTKGVRACTVLNVPLEEQRRIAEILDTIDETIQATERVIVKLTSAQTGVAHSVLKTAAPTSCQSTVEREFEIVSGITLNANRVPRSNPIGYLRVANVQRGRIDISALSMLEATEGEVMRKALAAGDLLVVEGHASPSEIGRCAAVSESAAGLLFQNHLFRLRPHSISSDAAQLILNSAEAKAYWRRMCSTSSGLHTINSSMLRAMPISVPSCDHQRVLSGVIESSANSLAAESRQLEKLRQLRSGLAADLLSGRVRTVAA